MEKVFFFFFFSINYFLKFYLELIQSLNIDLILNKFYTLSQLEEILEEISIKIGRIDCLIKEIEKLKKYFHIHYRGKNNTTIEISFSNKEHWYKFFLYIDFYPFNYPFGELKYSFKKLFGEILLEEKIHSIISTVPYQFGRLTNICYSIQKNLI